MADKQKKATITDPSKKLPGFTTSYANDITVEFTKLDLTLVFGCLNRAETESEIHIWSEQHSSLKMTFAQAKILAILLMANIANLEEKEIDPIKLPEGVLAKILPDGPADRPLTLMLEQVIQARKPKEDTESETSPGAPDPSSVTPS